MAFCAYCGSQLQATDRFCANCGAPVTIIPEATVTQTTVQTTPTVQTVYVTPGVTSTTAIGTGYEVILVSTGSATKTVCCDLLEDILGYTTTQARNLVNSAPTIIASSLNQAQAQMIAQALSEYGAQISVYDMYGNPVVFSYRPTASLYDLRTGYFTPSALAVLGTLTPANRVATYTTYRRPGLLENLFRIAFTPAPPRYTRRPTAPRPVTPRPAMNAVPPRPTAPRPAAPRPATRTVAPPKPAAPKPAVPRPAAPRAGSGSAFNHPGSPSFNPSGRRGGPQGSGSKR